MSKKSQLKEKRRIYINSVVFWKNNPKICSYENHLGRINARDKRPRILNRRIKKR